MVTPDLDSCWTEQLPNFSTSVEMKWRPKPKLNLVSEGESPNEVRVRESNGTGRATSRIATVAAITTLPCNERAIARDRTKKQKVVGNTRRPNVTNGTQKASVAFITGDKLR